MSSKNCSRCGHLASDDALFCPRCGNSLQGAAADPLVGTVVADRYLLVDKVGEGNSGTIYRAEHTNLRKKVAVKVLHHELSRDEDAVERFRREAITVGEFDNEHIVSVTDFGRAADGRLFFAMEWLDGETLATVIKRERQLSVPRAVSILRQVSEALVEAHSATRTGVPTASLQPAGAAHSPVGTIQLGPCRRESAPVVAFSDQEVPKSRQYDKFVKRA